MAATPMLKHLYFQVYLLVLIRQVDLYIAVPPAPTFAEVAKKCDQNWQCKLFLLHPSSFPLTLWK
jgi:hypothetical protein